MDELILRHLDGKTSDLEARRVGRWRAASSENERLYRETQEIWSASAPADAPPAPRPDLEAVLAEAEERRRRGRVRAGRRAVLRSPWTGYGLAAAAVAALLLVGLPERDAATGGGLLSPVESTVGVGDEVTMGLSDGSVLRLAGGTTVDFPPDPEARRVVLDGRAFFAVAEADVPFVVDAGGGEVRVLGTRFEVRTEGGELRVVVVEGTVSVASGGRTVRLEPGQVAYAEAGAVPRVVDRDPWSLLEWQGGLLVFQETPLAQVAEEVGRHFGRPVRVTAPELADRRVTAWFGGEPVEEVVSSVCLIVGARCRVQDDSVFVGR